MFFEGFALARVPVPGGTIRLRQGGSGPPTWYDALAIWREHSAEESQAELLTVFKGFF
jgi:hypothetical protein